MNVFYIGHGDCNFDGRTRELLKVAARLGNFYGITRGNMKYRISEQHYVYSGGYFSFIFKSIFLAKKVNQLDIIFVDNRKATIPALIIAAICKPKKIIYDMRELYLISEISYVSGKIGCMTEKLLVEKADIIICANEIRAKMMPEYFKCKGDVLFYENIRKLEYPEDVNIECYEKKYVELFGNSMVFRIIVTDGFGMDRGIDKFLLDSLKVRSPIEILMVGGGTPTEKAKIDAIIRKHNIRNVHLLGRVKQDELKYLISKCDCGLVTYHSRDVNNRYCASGKIYEFIFEGKPVVTSNNPPLREICDKYGVGVYGEDFSESIEMVISNYNSFVQNVNKLAASASVENNNDGLLLDIMDRLDLKVQNTQ